MTEPEHGTTQPVDEERPDTADPGHDAASGAETEQPGQPAGEASGPEAGDGAQAEDAEPVELSGSPSQRLAQLGLALPEVPAPVADYVPAVRTGRLRVHVGPAALRRRRPGHDRRGRRPAGRRLRREAAGLARRCAVNAVAAVASVVDLDSVVRVVKVTGFVASAPGFDGQPAVVNGASKLLGEVFGDAGRHARSAVGVVALPLGAPVEVEIVVEVG